MANYPGQVEGTPVYIQKETKFNHAFVFAGTDYTGDTIKFKAWEYSGASLDIDVAGTVSVSGGDTSVTVALSATNTDVSYARGVYSIHNETDDIILQWGELIVQEVPYS